MVALPPSPRRVSTLAALRAQIARLGGREFGGRETAEGVSREGTVPTGWPSIDAALPGGLPRGLVTEWFGVGEEPPSDAAQDSLDREKVDREKGNRERADREKSGREKPLSGAAPTRRPAPEPWTPPVSLLVHVAHQVVSGSGGAGQPTGPVLWIGERVWPYGRALVRAGPGGARLLARSLFVAISGSRAVNPAAARGRDEPARDGDVGARLWALDLALRCRAVAAVVADGSGFSMAASRRLQVAAEAGQAFVLLARPPEELDVLSAAGVRFVVTHVRQEPGELGAPGDAATPRTRGPAATWSLALRRAKGAAAREARAGESLAIEPLVPQCQIHTCQIHTGQIHTGQVHKQGAGRCKALRSSSSGMPSMGSSSAASNPAPPPDTKAVSSTGGRRILSLFLPTFSTDLVRRRHARTSHTTSPPSRTAGPLGDGRARGGDADGRARPAFLTTFEARGRLVVAHRCATAAAAGVAVGMGLAEARALLPGHDLVAAPLDAGREREALEALARWGLPLRAARRPRPARRAPARRDGMCAVVPRRGPPARRARRRRRAARRRGARRDRTDGRVRVGPGHATGRGRARWCPRARRAPRSPPFPSRRCDCRTRPSRR